MFPMLTHFRVEVNHKNVLVQRRAVCQTMFILIADELRFAISRQGYQLLEVYETHFFPQYSLGLFQNFMMSFAKMKVSSKGEKVYNVTHL